MIARGDAVALARDLTRIDSRNPAIEPGGPGECGVAGLLADVLRNWGMSVEIAEFAPGRPNVLARVGNPSGPALMFAGHLDVVGIAGMSHPPFDASIENGRLYGRGSADMKAGIAAMCSAAVRAAGAITTSDRQILVAAVGDEEFESAGMQHLVRSGIRADMAVVTEPTRLAICPAHKGFAWVEVRFKGRAAHGSRHDIGIDAIRHAALVLAELDALERSQLTGRTHPLLGRGSLHASTIEGGSGLTTYPEHCAFVVERRTLPGESAETALHEVLDACGAARRTHPDMQVTATLRGAQPPSDVALESAVVRAVERALHEEGEAVRHEGLSAWTDAAILNEAGIPAICFGPGDIGVAHAAEEFVELSQIEIAARVLERLARNWLMETN